MSAQRSHKDSAALHSDAPRSGVSVERADSIPASSPGRVSRISMLALSAGCAVSVGCSLTAPGHVVAVVRPASAHSELAPREMAIVGAATLLPPPLRGSRADAAADPITGAPSRAGLRFDPPIALASEEDAIVRIVRPSSTCTGTLIDDDLVLTAHHCVVDRTPSGGFSNSVADPRSIEVELGGDYLAWGRVSVKAIVAPPCGAAGGGGDLAILVLTRKLVGVPTKPVRLATAPRIGEELDVIGFGRCATSMGIRRMKRNGSPVRALTDETIHLAASVCPGDSGGPVVTRGSSEVVGVVSLSAMDGDESTRAPSVMARLDAYRAVFAQARMVADGAAANELPPLSCP